ncbi:MAG: DUF4148 domain-containing protein [Mogibacterium sp.]|nr:DUF4148 domain-containing protein [Mogibacterium sp.]
MKKIISIMIAAVMVMAMSVTAFAETMTQDAAVDLALSNAKLTRAQVMKLDAEFDPEENTYDVEFVRKSNKAEYDYEISAQDSKILEKSVEYKYKHNKSKKKIGKKAAMKKVAKFSGISYKTIRTGTCKYKYSHKKGVYKIKFRKGGCRYEYKVLAPTGKVIEYEWELI